METVIDKTKAMVKINPAIDPAYEALKREIESLCHHINTATVTTTDDVNRLTADVNMGQKLSNEVEKLRKAYKSPLTQYGKIIEAAFKPLSDPIGAARGVASQKIKKFNDEQRELQRLIDAENARKAREAAELQAEIDAENAKLMEQQTITDDGEISGPDLIAPEPEPEYIPPAPVIQKATTDFGSASEKMVGKWAIDDFASVPDEYKLLNEKAINAMVRNGVRSISGIKIWEEAEVSFRIK